MVFILALILGLSLTIGSGYYISKTGATGSPGSTNTPLFLLYMGVILSIITVSFGVLSILCAK